MKVHLLVEEGAKPERRELAIQLRDKLKEVEKKSYFGSKEFYECMKEIKTHFPSSNATWGNEVFINVETDIDLTNPRGLEFAKQSLINMWNENSGNIRQQKTTE